jgi:hypothetical protein
VAHAGRVADEHHAGGDALGEDARVVAGEADQLGQIAHGGPHARVERDALGVGGGRERDLHAGRVRELGGARGERVAPAGQPVGRGRAAVDPQAHAGWHRGERVRLDEDPRGGDEEVGVGARHAHRVGKRDPVVVAAREHVGDVEPPDQRPRAERRRVEAGALLVGERDHRDAWEPLGDREAGGDAERAVEAAAAAHAVEVGAGRPPRPGRVGDRPERAGGIAFDAQSGGARLLAEPGLGRGQLGGPREPRHAVGAAGVEPGEPVAQLVRADHERTRHAWSGRTQATSPPTITIATGLCPNRYGTCSAGPSSTMTSARLPGSSEPSSSLQPSTQAALRVDASSASRTLQP